MAATIKNFTTKGGTTTHRSRPVFPNNGGEPKPIRARLSQNGGLQGGSVKVTNPRATHRAGRVRTTGLGMGSGSGQQVTY